MTAITNGIRSKVNIFTGRGVLKSATEFIN